MLHIFRSTFILGSLLITSCNGTFEEKSNMEKSAKVNEEHITPFITGGFVDAGHYTVGALVNSNGGKCTGTLIATRTVLTAAHCISGNMQFYIKNRYYNSARTVVHPSNNNQTYENDIALVILKKDTNIPPSRINVVEPKPGWPITIVGFGRTDDDENDYGKKRAGFNNINSVYLKKFDFLGNSNTCFGDSGGPTFLRFDGEDVVAGIHSTNLYDCSYGGTDIRVDAYKDWIISNSRGNIPHDTHDEN